MNFALPQWNSRQTEILAILRKDGRVDVETLASHFKVTLQTIRRDLNELGEAQELVRIHGGAMVASGVANISYEARQLVAHESKQKIGEVAAALIPNDASLFINIGTTTEEVAKSLSHHSGLLVITNNLHVAVELHQNKSLEVIVTGGSIRRSDGGILGATTVSQIEQFHVDIAIIGTSAIDATGTLLDFDIREVEVSRAIIKHARKIILVSDSSKFQRAAPVRIGHLSEIDTLVTDNFMSKEMDQLCEECNVSVIKSESVGENEFDRGEN